MLNAVTENAAPRAQWRGKPIAAVLFDLDGTLLDTVADIALALNLALADHGWPITAGRRCRRPRCGK
jgi:beta-phosphoglucomutase-like phosphatase (HAD superfamily)